jgi:DNA topoisomerase-1
MLKLTAGPNGKYTPEELATIELEEVKKMIVTQDPKAFDKKTKGTPKKKAATKKAPAKKAPPKKK